MCDEAGGHAQHGHVQMLRQTGTEGVAGVFLRITKIRYNEIVLCTLGKWGGHGKSMRKYLSLRELQLTELELLEFFSDFCHRRNIRFYLIGGTLLGAIRHGGFIPWDDDIDVCMPRPDYNRFLSMSITNEFPDHIKRICGNEEKSPYAFSKLVDTRVYVNTIYSENADLNVWIDIFPVDGLPERKQERFLHYKKVEVLQTLQGLCTARVGEGTTKMRAAIKRFIKPIVQIGANNYRNMIERLAQKYSFESAVTVGVVNGSLHGVREAMDKEKFLCAQETFFERRYFPTFSCAHEYLKNLYGDYMVLPEPKERKQHIRCAWMGDN